MLDQGAPFVFAAGQIAVAVILALPAVFVRSLRRPVKLSAMTAAAVFVLVFAVAAVSNQTSPSGPVPIGATLYVGGLGGVIWATFFFLLAYVPLALFAFLRVRP